jgi:hypothetical protein
MRFDCSTIENCSRIRKIVKKRRARGENLEFSILNGQNVELRHARVRLSPVPSSKIHTLKKYFLSFTTHTLFYSIIFLNPPRSSYSKFILYINYHPYFIIFYTINFFSLIPISTTFHSFNFNAYLEFYLHLINIICELQFIKINNSFTFFYIFFFFFFFLFLFPFSFPFLSSFPSLSPVILSLSLSRETSSMQPRQWW